MDQGPKVGRILVEAFVIVSSILLAFGIDAWWDERKERVEETEILAGLHREFAVYRDELRDAIDLHGEMLEAMVAVLAAIESGEWTSTEWGPDEAIGRLLSPPTSDLGNGVRDALVQGGRLQLLSHAMLRERLAQWPAFHEELVDDQIIGRQMALTQIIPYLTRQGLDLSATLIAGTMVVDSESDAWPVRIERIADEPGALARLLTDPEFKSLVEVRYAFWHHAGGEYRSTLEMAEDILGLVEQAM